MPEIYAELSFSETNALTDVLNRLAAYEDTGLEPREAQKISNVFRQVSEEYNCWFDFAVKCFLEKANEPPNTPLTLDELRGMDPLEWLWVETIHPIEGRRFRNIRSAYYQVFEDYTDGEALCCGWPGVIHEFEYEDYCKTWLAYRRKPEEGAT